MTPNSQPLTTTENPYAAQRPTRNITWKVIFYVFFALAWIAFFVFGILIPSLTKDWLIARETLIKERV